MARALGRAELDVNWRLVFSSSSTPVHRLRKNGFYAGYATLEELQAECQNLSYSAISESFAVPMEIDGGSEARKAQPHTNQDSDSTANPAAVEMAADGDEVDEDVVEDFYIFDQTDKFVSLAELPLESEEALEEFFVQGKTDGGLRSTMFPINAWRVEYGRRPILFVRISKSQGKWAELGKPLKIYALETLRSMLVVLNLLNFVKNNLVASQKAIWEHVRKVCSHPEVEANEGDVLENLPIMWKLVRQDCELGNALAIQDLLRKRSEISEPCSRKRARLVVERDEESEEEDGDLGESICAICDDGGDLLCCDGPCLRSFHGTKSAAAESSSQCPSLCLNDLIVKQTVKYFCKNCAHNQHQCFECGELGISEGPSQEVFLCDVALCGRFYHLSCVSKLLNSEASAKGFSCTLHRCFECHEGEKEEDSSRLYPCRRCPRAWHRQCAEGIKFNDEDDGGGEIRGWKVGKARFLYCMRHKLVPHLGTPQRNHLKFPGECAVKNQVQSDSRDFDKGQLSSKGGLALDSVQRANKIKHRSKAISSRPSPVKVPAAKNQEAAVCGVKRMPVFPKEEVDDQVLAVISSLKRISPETVAAKLTIPSTVGASANKNIQTGKVESLLRAVTKACDCLRDGGTIEQAQSIFPCHHLKLFENSKESLKVYMSPLLYGMRYSSYGRHFTQSDKLQTIVERLHWYVNSGDMVVDLCCGANTFSRLMFKKLTEMNKSCYFKNYDIIQPNDTFNFKRKDYTTITKEELCPGDQLVIGLNPPFGVKGQTASKFAEYAAAFEPKIIIFIAPKETRRLEKNGYELIWADTNMLKGDAFYLPGSVDKEGKTINQENNVPPVLSLWSRGSWADKHRKIAVEQGHSRLWSENTGPYPCINSTLGEENEALQHMDPRESFKEEPSSVQDVAPTQANLVDGGRRMNFASEDIPPDILEDGSVEDVEMDVCMEAGEEVGVPEVFLKKPPLDFCNSQEEMPSPQECNQEHIVNTTTVMAEGATADSKQTIQYSPKRLPSTPTVDATSTFQSDQGSKSVVADCSSMTFRAERKVTAETQGQKGKALKDHSYNKTMSRLTDKAASHGKRERSPRKTSRQEGFPRKSSTHERKSSSQERLPRNQERSPSRRSSTQERLPRIQERSPPRGTSTQEISPRRSSPAANISRKLARRDYEDRRGHKRQAEYYHADRHDTYTRSNFEDAAWNFAKYQQEYISELDEGARTSDDGVNRRPWNLPVNGISHRHRQVSYEPVVNNVGSFYGERPNMPPPPPPALPHLGFNACFAREDGLLPSPQLYGYPGQTRQRYPSNR